MIELPVLKRMVLIIEELPNDVDVSVEGHTDNTGPGAKSPFFGSKSDGEVKTKNSILDRASAK